MTPLAVIGATALWLTFGWLACAAIAGYLSDRKGYGDRPGLASGLILTVLGVLIWLVVPAKATSDWKVVGPFGRAKPEEQLAQPTSASAGDGAGAVSADRAS